MSTEQLVREHATKAARALGTLPTTAPALGEAFINPRPVAKIFVNYLRVVQRMANLAPWEIQAISNVNQRINESENRVHKEQGADMFVTEFSKTIPRKKFVQTVATITDSKSAFYQAALAQLSVWMKEAHQQKISGVKMTDDNPLTHQVIMSQENIPNPVENRATIQHVIICHGIERYLHRVLSVKENQMAKSKDFFVNALTDMIAFDEARFGENSRFHELYKLWSRPKDQGGLGWISQTRVDAYRQEIEGQLIHPGLIDWKKASPVETAIHIFDPLKGTLYQSVLAIIKNKITEAGMDKARESVRKGELVCPKTSYRLKDGEELSGIIPYHVIGKEVAGVKRLFLLYIGSDGLIDNIELKRLEGIEVREAGPNERYAGEPLVGFHYLSPKSPDGKLETKLRWVKLRGISFGVAPGHIEVEDRPAYYFVGDDQQYDPAVDKIQGLRRFPDDRIEGLKGKAEERLPTFSKQTRTTSS